MNAPNRLLGRRLLYLAFAQALGGCAVVRHISYSHPTADSSGAAIAHAQQGFYARTGIVLSAPDVVVSMALQNEGGGFCAFGLIVPIIPWNCRGASSKEFLHALFSVTALDEALVFDPARILMVVAGDGTFTPECAALQHHYDPRHSLWDARYVFLIHRDATGKCESGLYTRAAGTLSANSVDTIPPRTSRSYQLLYAIRPDEGRTLTMRAFGVSKGSTVLDVPQVHFERKTRWSFFFGDPF